MKKVIRSIIPVGQGAFYCERFRNSNTSRDINVVYDCGTSTGKKIIGDQIKNTFEKGEIIDAVFISHLHNDHISGIPFLLKYCKVEKIILPLLSYVDKYLLLIYEKTTTNDEYTTRLLMDSDETIHRDSPDTEVVYVNPYNEDIQFDNGRLDGFRIRSGDNVFGMISSECTKADDKLGYWEYVPFNIKMDSRRTELEKELRVQFGKPIGMKEVVDRWKAGLDWDKIKRAYKALQGGFNINSMVLFSGIRSAEYYMYANNKTGRCICDNLFCGCTDRYKPGVLFTGDYDAKSDSNMEVLLKVYRDYLDYIGCIQIPHHGSKNSFNNKFLDYRAVFYSSSGAKNSFHHPHAYVMKEFLLHRKLLHIVTEYPESALYMTVEHR